MMDSGAGGLQLVVLLSPPVPFAMTSSAVTPGANFHRASCTWQGYEAQMCGVVYVCAHRTLCVVLAA